MDNDTYCDSARCYGARWCRETTDAVVKAYGNDALLIAPCTWNEPKPYPYDCAK